MDDEWKEISRLLKGINQSLGDDEIEVAPSKAKPGTYLVIRHVRQLELVDASLAEVRKFLGSLKQS
jgi:hypothetical protein